MLAHNISANPALLRLLPPLLLLKTKKLSAGTLLGHNTSYYLPTSRRCQGKPACSKGIRSQKFNSSKPGGNSLQGEIPSFQCNGQRIRSEDIGGENESSAREGSGGERRTKLINLLLNLGTFSAFLLLAALVYESDIYKAHLAAKQAYRRYSDKLHQAKRQRRLSMQIDDCDATTDLELEHTQLFLNDNASAAATQTEKSQQGESSKEQTTQSYEEANYYSCYQTPGEDSGMMIFSGSSNAELAREVCAHLNTTIGRMKLTSFADGEVSLDVLDDVRSRDVYLFQSVPNASTGLPLHSHIMELFLAISALRRASAERITAVLPYMAYTRQEHSKSQHPTPLAIGDMARIMHTLGVDRVVFVDLHAPRAVAFFPEPIPITNLLPQSLAIKYLKKKNLRSPVVVAPEHTAGERGKLFWSRLKKEIPDVGMVTLLSNRQDRLRLPTVPGQNQNDKTDAGSNLHLVGDVQNRDCIVVDDIIDTGIRLANAIRACKQAGARKVYVYASHGLLSKGSVDRLDKSEAEEVLVTNTIEIPPNIYSKKIKILNISKLLAEVLKRLHAEVSGPKPTSVGSLYRDADYDSEALKTIHSQ